MPIRPLKDRDGSHGEFLKEKLLELQRTYICIKTLRKVALLALLFEVIFRLILQLKIFNYWVVLFWV